MRLSLIGVLVLLLMACVGQPVVSVVGQAAKVEVVAFEKGVCSAEFRRNELDHITTNSYEPIDMYDSNGAGVAVNDLDGDGDIDIVLANLAENSRILWNEGDFKFRTWEFPYGNARAVATVDTDADGLLDIVFTSRHGTLLHWRNLGSGKFVAQPLVGISEYTYSMAWDDLDGDGDLDVVTGSYDTALEKELQDSFMMGDGAGVFVFTNEGDHFATERLADASQALAIQLLDLDEDGRKDILVGNDFASVRDMYWLNDADEGWVSAEPFLTTTENTMSFDIGDINNDGTLELFAADMHPYDGEPMAAWEPVMALMMANHVEVVGDPQTMANVLLTREGSQYNDEASARGVDGTGWSWSTKFGDLNQDGFLDLYSVNGMASVETFGHLPDATLVEHNQIRWNIGGNRFEATPERGLNQTDGGRGMSMADVDNDGDLDIVINNLLGPATLLENQLCEGTSVKVDLRWPDSANQFAIGAVATLQTSMGTLTRDVRVMSGYLSGDATTLHFGLPADATIEMLTIVWPDGEQTDINRIRPGTKVVVKRID